MNSVVVGIGYDSHKIDKKRKLVLGGLEIKTGFGLAGHSDADVLCHAVIDALLGACGKPDIGCFFPDNEPEWKDADSIVLLKSVVALVKSESVKINYVDVVLIAEKPKIAPHVDAIRKNLAAALGISFERVNIKAKTNEGMGFAGRGEGIAALSNVTVERSFND
jgi:2-C-methyl-D-erythritol 2,4-cyclodiphosphate synthase